MYTCRRMLKIRVLLSLLPAAPVKLTRHSWWMLAQWQLPCRCAESHKRGV